MGADAHGDKSLVGVCELNRNVLRADLKESTVRILHRESGSSFQAFGAATEKECCPKSDMDVSMTRSPRAAERSHDTTVDTGRQRSDKYDGAKPLTALNTSRYNLNWIRFGTGSQCRRSGVETVTVLLFCLLPHAQTLKSRLSRHRSHGNRRLRPRSVPDKLLLPVTPPNERGYKIGKLILESLNCRL